MNSENPVYPIHEVQTVHTIERAFHINIGLELEGLSNPYVISKLESLGLTVEQMQMILNCDFVDKGDPFWEELSNEIGRTEDVYVRKTDLNCGEVEVSHIAKRYPAADNSPFELQLTIGDQTYIMMYILAGKCEINMPERVEPITPPDLYIASQAEHSYSLKPGSLVIVESPMAYRLINSSPDMQYLYISNPAHNSEIVKTTTEL